MTYTTLFEALLPAAHEAGKAIMGIYKQGFEVHTKGDSSPVTEADRLGEEILLAALRDVEPDVPVVAEEAAAAGNIPKVGERFFLVDPLDGTKEFINKRKEFTVNIGLIEKGQPTFGLVYAPALHKIYYSISRDNAFMAKLNPETVACELENVQRITTATPSPEGFVVVASLSHMTNETEQFLMDYEILATKAAGSSLKFCLLAAGEADLYPRLGPTMEWDTAAGHAVLNAAGGLVVKEDGAPLTYGNVEQDFRNPYFIAWGQKPEKQV